METFYVPALNKSVSRIGLGTAPFGGRVARKQAMRVLHNAHERGINLIDTARSYGFGECEDIVGEFLSKVRREDFVIFSKGGISTPRSSRARILAKNVARSAVRLMPSLRRAAVSVAAKSYSVSVTLASVESSLKESLAAIRTDYLDCYFLHSPPTDPNEFERIASFLAEQVRSTRLRGWGLTLDREGATLVRQVGVVPPFVQFSCSSDAEEFDLPNGTVRVGFQLLGGSGTVTSRRSAALRIGAAERNPALRNELLQNDLLGETVCFGAAIPHRCDLALVSMNSAVHMDRNIDALTRAMRLAAHPALLSAILDDARVS